jgi:hypothetical protein
LGYSPFGVNIIKYIFAAPKIPKFSGNIQCEDNITSLHECSINEFQRCEVEIKDLGLICQDASVQYSNCSDGEVRLVGGQTLTEGRVEICMDHVWGSICDDGWDTYDANVVCSQMGLYPLGAIPRYGAFYGEGSGPIFLSGVGCNGSESHILDCSRNVFGGGYCKHYEDAGVKCHGSFPVVPSRKFGSLFGGEIVFISGPTFSSHDTVLCQFGSVQTDGSYLSDSTGLCVAPPSLEVGITDLKITIIRNKDILSGTARYRYISPFVIDFKEPFDVISDEFALGVGETLQISWDPNVLAEGLISIHDITITISIIMFDDETETWQEEDILASNISNVDSTANVTIPDYSHVSTLSIKISEIRLSVSVSNTSSVPRSLAENILHKSHRSVLRYIVRKVYKDTSKRFACEDWYEQDDGITGTKLPSCPCNLFQMRADSHFKIETPFQFVVSRVFFRKSNAISCYRQGNIGSYSSSQQCCYDSYGRLLTGIGGGRVYKVYPNNWPSIIGHLARDVTPFYLCCYGYFKACNRYYARRPNDNCLGWPGRTTTVCSPVALRNILHLCPSIARFLINTYRQNVNLFINGTSIVSQEGTTQGDPLGMAMHAIATIPLINSISSSCVLWPSLVCR